MHIFHDASRGKSGTKVCKIILDRQLCLTWLYSSWYTEMAEYLTDWLTLVLRLVSILLLHWSFGNPVSVVLSLISTIFQNPKPDKHKSLEWQEILTTVVNKSENKCDLEVKILTVLQNLKKNLSFVCKFMLLNKQAIYMLWSHPFHSISLLCWVTNFYKIHTYLW
jgi:hypothetical protein